MNRDSEFSLYSVLGIFHHFALNKVLSLFIYLFHFLVPICPLNKLCLEKEKLVLEEEVTALRICTIVPIAGSTSLMLMCITFTDLHIPRDLKEFAHFEMSH